jgi:hypothetical protein
VPGSGQETILALANGRRTARDMAFMLGRGVYAVTLQLARMHADGLLVPGSRRMVQPQPSDPGRPAGQDGAQDAATNAAEGAGEQAPALPRRRRGSSGQPRRPRSPGGQMDRAALLRLLRPGSTGADEDSN